MIRFIFALLLFAITAPTFAAAQQLVVATVTRPPFSMVQDGVDTGFSVELWRNLAVPLGTDYRFERYDSFAEMLGAVETGEADLAIANISITATREQVMDFSQPIFESGLQIMIPSSASGVPSLWSALFSRDLMLAVVAAFAMLFCGGMLMWWFERKAQPYFDRPASEALFPSFWWALNLVVNGGFEERVPRTPFGRFFGTLLVVSSLFIVSVFVAKITSVMTVEAITQSVTSVNDLYGRRVGTIDGSTAASFLERRDVDYRGYAGLDPMLDAFESGGLDAVVFDAPILAYYANTEGDGIGMLAGPAFLRENYGIALPSGSTLSEPINQGLLALREDGTYQDIYRSWFGTGP